MSDKHVLYHYTDAKSAEKIKESGFIKQTPAAKNNRDDARYGPGVYGTSMEPNRPSRDIAWNNYDDGARVYERKMNRTEVALECHVSKDKITIVNDKHGRDICVHEGDISMNDVKHIHNRKPDIKK